MSASKTGEPKKQTQKGGNAEKKKEATFKKRLFLPNDSSRRNERFRVLSE